MHSPSLAVRLLIQNGSELIDTATLHYDRHNHIIARLGLYASHGIR